MFCPKCGNQVADGAKFCRTCGNQLAAPQQAQQEQQQPQYQQAAYQQPVPQIFDQPAPALAGVPDSAAKAKPRSGLKIVLIILVLAILAGIVGLIFWLTGFFSKPGDDIVGAAEGTEKADSFKAVLTLEYDLEGISDFMDDMGEGDSEDIDAQLEEMGMSADDFKSEAVIYVKGKDDDFRMKLIWANMLQLRLDSDGMSYMISNDNCVELLGSSDKLNVEQEIETPEEYSRVFDIIASRDIIQAISDDDELDELLTERVTENYNKLKDVFIEMLNDKGADYILDYEKKDGAYNYKIDAVKFLEAFLDNDTLDFDRSTKKLADSLEDEIDQDITIDLSVKTSGGRLESVKAGIIINDHKLTTVGAEFSDYDNVSDDDLEFEELSGDISDPVLVPSLMNYVKKSKMRSANSNAKLAYTTIETVLVDKEAEGSRYTKYGEFMYDLDNYDSSDPIESALYDNFKYGAEVDPGYIYYEISRDGNLEFVQWSQDGVTYVGQYPSPVTDVNEDVTFGKKADS